jgi:DNA-binding PadR family transcriptional regulator
VWFWRGAVELHVLHHAAEREIHGAWMAAELARHGYAISPGTLYPTLHRLRDQGLLTCRDEVVEGGAGACTRITDSGPSRLTKPAGRCVSWPPRSSTAESPQPHRAQPKACSTAAPIDAPHS